MSGYNRTRKHSCAIGPWALLLVLTPMTAAPGTSSTLPTDIHSFSRPMEVRVRHVDLDLEADFARKILRGFATLHLERSRDAGQAPLVLDTRDLEIAKTEAAGSDGAFHAVRYSLGRTDKILGTELIIEASAAASRVRIWYQTSPSASGLQWLSPAQTAAKRHPFLFSQSQAIHARSWIPLQDTPGVRFTYNARIRTPKALIALMSAENDPKTERDGEYTFRMPQPIPSYLMAIAVGDLMFRALSNRTGVYAEPPIIEAAAKEFSDTEKMVQAAESLYGPYRWGRYDLLVLPPSFPFGGMENPRLTFVTPTVLAGDKSLVSLVAHELAHSWSGNLVTNATWSDFWLNEGVTTYIERRIEEVLYGERRASMEAALGRQSLEKEIERLDDRFEILHVDLTGMDPDEGVTDIPYEKGALFLRTLEETFGRKVFDVFLRGYFDHFAFQSITTAQFIGYLKKNLFVSHPEQARRIPLEEWIYKAGVPAGAANPVSDAFEKAEQRAARWHNEQVPIAKTDTAGWTTQEWLAFLRYFEDHRLTPEQMARLDRQFQFTQTGNSEIEFEWLLLSVRYGYTPAYSRLEEFLTTVGRRKFLRPLYEELVKTPEGAIRARSIYAKARPGYHPIAQATVDEILKVGSN
ncbi:MAG: M1 family metallopeptidase [Bryobacterales bacterium]|nr:M1 family metallopeptidase [Bryobacterales bacterium]MEB2361724.1 M1 family metallopeptidase [Bryobacterales bacterium]